MGNKVETAVEITGTWIGINYTSKVRGPHEVKLVFQQTGNKVTGVYHVGTGVCGKGKGALSGCRMEMLWKNVSPECPANIATSI